MMDGDCGMRFLEPPAPCLAQPAPNDAQASSRKERLQWNKDRTLLNRKVAEAEARAREAADGVASPEEVGALCGLPYAQLRGGW